MQSSERPTCTLSSSWKTYVGGVFGKREGVPADLHCFEAVSEGDIDDLIILDFFVRNGQDNGEENAAIGGLPLAMRTIGSLLDLDEIILHRVLKVDKVELRELIVQTIEELVDELDREGVTVSHMVNSKLRN